MRPQKLVFSVLDWTHVEARAWCAKDNTNTHSNVQSFESNKNEYSLQIPC